MLWCVLVTVLGLSVVCVANVSPSINLSLDTRNAPWAPRIRGSGVVKHHSHVMVIGGLLADDEGDELSYTNDVLELDLKTQIWRNVTSSVIFSPSSSHSPSNTSIFRRAYLASCIYNSSVYVSGGVSSSGDAWGGLCMHDRTHDTWRCDADANTDDTATNSYEPRFGHGMAVLNDKLFVFGGYSSGALFLYTVWSYSSSSLMWHPEASIPWQPRAYFSVASTENYIIIAGGWNDAGTLNDIWKMSSSSVWTLVRIPSSSSFHPNRNACFASIALLRSSSSSSLSSSLSSSSSSSMRVSAHSDEGAYLYMYIGGEATPGFVYLSFDLANWSRALFNHSESESESESERLSGQVSMEIVGAGASVEQAGNQTQVWIVTGKQTEKGNKVYVFSFTTPSSFHENPAPALSPPSSSSSSTSTPSPSPSFVSSSSSLFVPSSSPSLSSSPFVTLSISPFVTSSLSSSSTSTSSSLSYHFSPSSFSSPSPSSSSSSSPSSSSSLSSSSSSPPSYSSPSLSSLSSSAPSLPSSSSSSTPSLLSSPLLSSSSTEAFTPPPSSSFSPSHVSSSLPPPPYSSSVLLSPDSSSIHPSPSLSFSSSPSSSLSSSSSSSSSSSTAVASSSAASFSSSSSGNDVPIPPPPTPAPEASCARGLYSEILTVDGAKYHQCKPCPPEARCVNGAIIPNSDIYVMIRASSSSSSALLSSWLSPPSSSKNDVDSENENSVGAEVAMRPCMHSGMCKSGYKECGNQSYTLHSGNLSIVVQACCDENRISIASNPMCGDCIDVDSQFGGQCFKCTSTNWAVLGPLLIAAGVYMLLFHFLAQSSTPYLKILLFLTQILYVMFDPTRNLQSPSEADTYDKIAQSPLLYLAVTRFDFVTPVGATCLSPMSSFDRLYTPLISVLVCGGLLFAWFSLFYCLRMQLGGRPEDDDDDDDGARSRNHAASQDGCCWAMIKTLWCHDVVSTPAFVRSAGMFYSAQYISTAYLCFSYFHCITVNGSSVLSSLPTLSCSSPSYLRMLPFQYVLLVLVLLVPPLVLMLAVSWCHSTGLSDNDTVRRYCGVVYQHYERCVAWDTFHLYRSLILVLISVFVNYDLSIMFSWLSVAFILFLSLFVYVRPYKHAHHNSFEIAVLLVLALTTAGSSSQHIWPLSISRSLLISTCLSLVILFFSVTGLIGCIREARAHANVDSSHFIPRVTHQQLSQTEHDQEEEDEEEEQNHDRDMNMNRHVIGVDDQDEHEHDDRAKHQDRIEMEAWRAKIKD